MKKPAEPPRWALDDSGAPAELRQLLGASRDALGTPDQVARLQAQLATTLGPQAGLGAALADGAPQRNALPDGPALRGDTLPGSPWLAAPRRVAPRLAAMVGGGLVAGAVIWAVAARSPAGSAPEADAMARAPLAAAVQVETGARPVEPAPRPALAAPVPTLEAAGARVDPPVQPKHSRAARGSAGAGVAEAQLLERAQRELARNPTLALALAEEHRRRFPSGLLAEEREVIAIDALERLGRHAAAKARAASFTRRYQGSVHVDRVRGGVAVPPDAPAPAPRR